MKTLVTHSILVIGMLFTFVWAATSAPGDGQVVVRVDPGHRHQYRLSSPILSAPRLSVIE
jgi:hypothetical protein